jgi:hypothetical protein
VLAFLEREQLFGQGCVDVDAGPRLAGLAQRAGVPHLPGH